MNEVCHYLVWRVGQAESSTRPDTVWPGGLVRVKLTPGLVDWVKYISTWPAGLDWVKYVSTSSAGWSG